MRGQHHYNVRGVFVTLEVCTIIDLQVPAKSVAKLNENLIHGENGGKTAHLLYCSTRNFIPCRNTTQTSEWKVKILRIIDAEEQILMTLWHRTESPFVYFSIFPH